MKTRVTLILAAALAAAVLTGCSAAPAESSASAASAESTATPAQESVTRADAGVALGADLQRTRAGDLGGKLWVMSVTGKADLAGANPVISLVALDATGRRTVVQNVKADDTSGVGSIQVTFVRPLPASVTTLVVTTTLRASDATAPAPAISVPLADVPQVDKLTLTGE